MTTVEFTYHQDPGHGWVEVPVSIIKQYNIVDKISVFSYYDSKRKLVYLEEDCDADLIWKALKSAGIEVKFVPNHVEYTFIRNLPPYNKTKIK